MESLMEPLNRLLSLYGAPTRYRFILRLFAAAALHDKLPGSMMQRSTERPVR